MPREPITCHVLDTYSGKPAAGLRCTLMRTKMGFAGFAFSGTTDSDGRISKWTNPFPGVRLRTALDELFNESGPPPESQPENNTTKKYATQNDTIQNQPQNHNKNEDQDISQKQNEKSNQSIRSTWSLRLENVDEWYRKQGVEDCFWPEVVVAFTVRGWEGEEGWRHHHVPVLLGPWHYSTYRGS
ncbi:hypothetical protein FQN57_000393 [Myotisia sp. PD_48]|nr:hypothetical protein FQN57_000393 [Myotisia sp. PD_48]